ncbi:MAG TPA: NAD(P)/FAD-dependent oxidoreductase [Paracoccaceae bacterium]|nr:NAD(P)/FAD-dependent oxidoreductase [Paracoccaceae bacterium]
MLDTDPGRLSVLVQDWLDCFGQALASGDPGQIAQLFHTECWWRDAVAFTGTLETVAGREAVAGGLVRHTAGKAASSFRLDPARIAPAQVARAGSEAIEAFFRFEMGPGTGEGVLRLTPDGDGRYLGWTLLTALDQIRGREARVGANRRRGQSYSRDFSGPNWLDKRREAAAYAERDPAVLVVGGGQAGLAVAARLTVMGVDTLIVDREARIGDNWRRRYHALTLHNLIYANHLPYMPFPDNWPVYIPKDMLANWFEAYADALELNFWTSTELLGGSYDDGAGCWTVRVRLADGSTREMRPRHVVMATGVSGIPNRPAIPTLDAFRGRVMHSHEFTDGGEWRGRSAIVIGTGNSGHDIAQDLHSSGARVTIVQRSPTLIVNIEPSAQLAYALYEEGPSLEECDLIVTGTPFPLVRRTHIGLTERSREIDKPLLDRLEARGFRLDFGEDGSGWQFKYLTRGGGYYFNVGSSDLIADGHVGLAQMDEIDGFEADGARLKDGGRLPADLVVLATGYRPQEELVERLFGAEVTARVGPIWGFGDESELRAMFRASGQPGLWFIAGSLAQCRIYSRYLAQQIALSEPG